MQLLFIIVLMYATPACQPQCVSCLPQQQYQPCCAPVAANIQTIQSSSSFSNGATGSQVVMYYNGQRVLANGQQNSGVLSGYNTQNQRNYQNPGAPNTGYYQNTNQTGFYPYPSTMLPTTNIFQPQQPPQQQQEQGPPATTNDGPIAGGNINSGSPNQQQISAGGNIRQQGSSTGNGVAPQSSQNDPYNYATIAPSTNELGYQPFVPSGNTEYANRNEQIPLQGQPNSQQNEQATIYSYNGSNGNATPPQSTYNSPNSGYIENNNDSFNNQQQQQQQPQYQYEQQQQPQIYPQQIVTSGAVTPQSAQQQYQDQTNYDNSQQGYNHESVLNNQDPSIPQSNLNDMTNGQFNNDHSSNNMTDPNTFDPTSPTPLTSPENVDEGNALSPSTPSPRLFTSNTEHLSTFSPIIPIITPVDNFNQTANPISTIQQSLQPSTMFFTEPQNYTNGETIKTPTTIPVQNIDNASSIMSQEANDVTTFESVTGYQQPTSSSAEPYMIGSGAQGQQQANTVYQGQQEFYTSTSNYNYQNQNQNPYSTQFNGQQYDQTTTSSPVEPSSTFQPFITATPQQFQQPSEQFSTQSTNFGSSSTLPGAHYPSQQEILAVQENQSTSQNQEIPNISTLSPQMNPQQQYLDETAASPSTVFPTQNNLTQSSQLNQQPTFHTSPVYGPVGSSTPTSINAQYPSQQEIFQRDEQSSSAASRITPVYGDDMNTQYGHYESSTADSMGTTQFASNPQFDPQQSASNGRLLNGFFLLSLIIFALIM